MNFFLDCIYIALLIVGAPFILAKRKLRRGLWVRLRAAIGAGRLKLDPARKTILVHCVSVGEVAASVSLVKMLEESFPEYQVVVSTTTPQGMETARKRMPENALTYFPLDLSFGVARFLDRISPSLVVLMELEAWPNFLRACRLRKVPVVLANGRLTELSLQRYLKASFFSREVFSLIDRYLIQNDEYKERFLRLGVPEKKISVAGNIKYDSVRTEPDIERTRRFAELFGLDPSMLILIGGSTYAEEERALAKMYKKLKTSYPRLRLILAPRQVHRLDELKSILDEAELKYALRSSLDKERPGDISERVIILDTVGELSDVYALGSVVFVGGSLVDRGGHNIVEPAALGISTVFGPNTYNFNESTRFLLNSLAAIMARDASELEEIIDKLLSNPETRRKLGGNAAAAVMKQKGAVEKHVSEISRFIRCAACAV